MAKDPYPAEMVDQWSTLEHQQRDTDAAFAGERERGAGLFAMLFWLAIIAWVGVAFLPGTALWESWGHLKADTFASIGLSRIYSEVPIIASISLVVIAWYGARIIMNRFLFPLIDAMGLLGLLLLPMYAVVLAVMISLIVVGAVDGLLIVVNGG